MNIISKKIIEIQKTLLKKTTQIFPVIQSLWIGKSLTDMEKICISSFLKNGYRFHLYVYEKTKGIPHGTKILDANYILPSCKIFKYSKHDSYAGFSNMFRYKLLYLKGGYWVDTDVFCLNHFNEKSDFVFSSERQNNNNKLKVATCIIKSPPESEIMDYCYKESIKKIPSTLSWGETGPELLTKAISKFNMWDHVFPPETFCPIDWWEWRYFINDSDMNILNNSLSVHFWNEMWRRNGINKSETFQNNCVYEQLKHMVFNEKKRRFMPVVFKELLRRR